jgi:hypothetical protein
MLIAIAVLFALYVSSSRKEKMRQRIVLKKTNDNKTSARNANQPQSRYKDADPERPQCPHHFGFLKTRKDKDVPEECAGCERLLSCMFPRE